MSDGVDELERRGAAAQGDEGAAGAAEDSDPTAGATDEADVAGLTDEAGVSGPPTEPVAVAAVEETGEPSTETPAAPAEASAAAPAEPAAPSAEPAGVAAAEGMEEHATGELRIPDGVGVFAGSADGRRRTVGVAVSRFNGEITSRLLDGALAALEEAGVARDAIDVMPVPGAFELPLAAMALAKTRRYSCVLALGCVIRGETPHFEYVSAEAASGIQLAQLETGIPVSFGVLTCETREQAEARAGGERGNKGAEAARAGLEMADVFTRLRASTG